VSNWLDPLKRAARCIRGYQELLSFYQEREQLYAKLRPVKKTLSKSVLFVYKPYYLDHQLHSWILYFGRRFRNVEFLRLSNENCPRSNPHLKTPILLRKADRMKPGVVFSYESLITSEEADRLRAGGSEIGVVISGVHSYFRGGEPSQPEAIETLRKYDWYIVSQARHLDVLREQGVRAYVLPFSAETSWFYPLSVQKSIDVLFVGDFLSPLNTGRRSLLQHLAEDFQVGIISGRDPEIQGCKYIGHSTDPKRVNRWLNAARVVLGSDFLGDTSALNGLPGQFLFYDDEHFVRQRNVIALSAGSCFCVERHKAVADLFEEDVEIVLYDGIDDLKKRIRMLLAEPQRRLKIGQMGRMRVLREHATEVRIAQLGEIMGFL
jgi:hypothetical protein